MNPAPNEESQARQDVIRVLALAALLFLVQLGARDLWNPNEPAYGRAVAEMSERGDWLIPTVNGVVFAEKPILYFWMARATGVVGGVNELTLRLPSAFSGLIGVMLVYLLVYPYAGRERARISAFLFATLFVVFWSARSVQMDLLVTVTTLGAVLAATRVLDHGADPVRGWSLAGLAAGLGMLAKGPVGLICPGLVVFGYLLVGRRLRELRWNHLALAAAVCLLVAAPWFAMLAIRGEWAILHEVLFRQNVSRFVAPWDHQEPWWYFAKYLWIDMAPWAVLLPLAAGLGGRDEGERSLDRLAWVWIASIVFFFSLSASKRSPYILPVAPAVAALAAAPIERLISGTLDRVRRRAMTGLLAVGGGLFLALGIYLLGRGVEDYPALETAGRGLAVLSGVGGAATIAGLLFGRRWPVAAPAALVATVISVYLLAATWVLPAANAYKSARPFCTKVQALVGEDDPLRSYGFWMWRASYAYYTDRAIENIDSSAELRLFWNRDEQVFLLVERGKLKQVREVLGSSDPLIGERIGSNEIYLFTNR